ncbi:MAG TPA: PIN domain-containing protein [Kofleriaceae bacterium]|nr:PIN domain-containing protein [Kofleriaceae bacterium]
MNAVLDAGALIAIDRRDRRVGAMLRLLQQRRVPVWTSAAVLAQVWRDGRRQARLAQLLAGVGVRALSATEARRAGELQAATGTNDVADAHLALLVSAGDVVLTGDADDISRLLASRRVKARLVAV